MITGILRSKFSLLFPLLSAFSPFFPCAEACAGSVRRAKSQRLPHLAGGATGSTHVLHSTISRRVTYACVTNIRAPTGKYWGVGACVMSRTLLVRLFYGVSTVALSCLAFCTEHRASLQLRPVLLAARCLQSPLCLYHARLSCTSLPAVLVSDPMRSMVFVHRFEHSLGNTTLQ